MKIRAAIALLLVFAVRAEAQLQPAPWRTDSMLQLELDVNKTLVTEALLARGRKAMQQRPDDPPGQSAALERFINERTQFIAVASRILSDEREKQAKEAATKAGSSAPLSEDDRRQ